MAIDKDFSLDQKLARIRAIVEEMQKGVIEFDKQVALFREGSTLIKECQAFLHHADLEVRQLIDGVESPFDSTL
jgi:exodeoxyribonuclease VII small subunit